VAEHVRVVAAISAVLGLAACLQSPPEDHQVYLWAEAGAGNRAIAEIQSVVTTCGE
jgi:hypothetical protein